MHHSRLQRRIHSCRGWTVAESLACLNGLQLANSLGILSLILETDADQILALALMSSTCDRTELRTLFLEIKSRMKFNFFCCKISKCPRACNSIADVLASYGATLDASESSLWLDQALDFVLTMVSGELPGSRLIYGNMLSFSINK